ncbi:MAG: hypothetical protein HY904_09695 [Deltaproteobacteria bacterium]|nr:hypothetical protein [Deltaproteobacteria bacterium]
MSKIPSRAWVVGVFAWTACQGRDSLDYFDLPRRVEEQRASPVRWPPSALTLRGVVDERLGLPALTAGFGGRPLEIALVASVQFPGYVEEDVRMTDALVGTMEVTRLVPRTSPRGAVVGIHGHDRDRQDFSDNLLGRELAASGLLVMMPTLRAMECDAEESAVAAHLSANHLSLMGVRVYEVLLVLKHLDGRPDVPRGHVALMGHSGGSTVAALVARVTSGVSVLVTDYDVDFLNRCPRPGKPDLPHCETIPAFRPLRSRLQDPGTLDLHWLKVPYAYGDAAKRAEIIRFVGSYI